MNAQAEQPPAAITTDWTLLAPNGQQLPILHPVHRIGRNDDCELVIPHPGVSGRHAVLRVDDDRLTVEDEGSKNGTFVNAQLIDPHRRAPLKDGDTLRISKTCLAEFRVARCRPGGPSTPLRRGIADPLQVLRLLNAFLDESEVLAAFARGALSLVPAERAIVVMQDADGGDAAHVAAVWPHDCDAGREPADYDISRSAVEKVLRRGQTVMQSNVAWQMSDPTESAERYHLKSLLCVPITLRQLTSGIPAIQTAEQVDQVLGALYMDSREATASFDRADIDRLSLVCDFVAVSINHARLHRRIVQRERQQAVVAREIALAADIQRGLLPTDFDQCGFAELFAITRPAETAGGDFYDFHAPDADRLNLSVGDVAGHGIGAAVLMATAQACFWSAGDRATRSPSAILGEASRLIARRVARGRFVTSCYGQLHRSGLFVFAVAGHPAPIVRRRDGRIETFQCQGPALGIPELLEQPGVHFEERWIRLDPGDVVLLFTDGLIEAAGETSRFNVASTTQLLASLPADAACHDIARTLIDTVCRFSGDRLDDDVTVLVIKYQPPETSRG